MNHYGVESKANQGRAVQNPNEPLVRLLDMPQTIDTLLNRVQNKSLTRIHARYAIEWFIETYRPRASSMDLSVVHEQYARCLNSILNYMDNDLLMVLQNKRARRHDKGFPLCAPNVGGFALSTEINTKSAFQAPCLLDPLVLGSHFRRPKQYNIYQWRK